MRLLVPLLLVAVAFAQAPATSVSAPDRYANCCADIPLTQWVFATTGKYATPTFSTEYAMNWLYYPMFGQSDETNVAKRTFNGLKIQMNSNASGQNLVSTTNLNAQGMGDAIVQSSSLGVFGSTTSGGDEGQMLYRGAISNGGGAFTQTIGSPSASTCNTTTTQAISVSTQTPQLVTVASSTNCNVGNWLTIESGRQTDPPVTTNEEVVKITAVAAGSITATFMKAHNSGVAVNSATVIPAQSGGFNGFGQDRLIIDLTKAVVGAGTVSGSFVAGPTYTGVGTAFANNLVGGNANNPGCIKVAADSANGTDTWYPIDAISSATSLTIYSRHSGRSTTISGVPYTIAPCARVRNFVIDTTTTPPTVTSIVLSFNPYIWSSGDNLESSIAPDAYVSGFKVIVNPTMPNTTWNWVFSVRNEGIRDTTEPVYNLVGATGAGFPGGYQSQNAKSDFIVVADATHIGNSLNVTTAVGNPKRIEWAGPLTTPADWNIGPEDATGNFTIFQGATQLLRGFQGQSLPAVGVNGAIGVVLSTPANSGATCAAGAIWADTGFVYVCTAANTIKRVALSTF